MSRLLHASASDLWIDGQPRLSDAFALEFGRLLKRIPHMQHRRLIHDPRFIS